MTSTYTTHSMHAGKVRQEKSLQLTFQNPTYNSAGLCVHAKTSAFTSIRKFRALTL